MTFATVRIIGIGLQAMLFTAAGSTALALHSEPTADAVIQKAVERSQKTELAPPPDLDYTKVTMTEELDAAGRVRERTEKVYSVSFRSGSAQAKLEEVNGLPPSPADARKQEAEELNLQKLLGNSKDAPESARASEDRFLTPEIVDRFDFILLGETNLNGRQTYEVRFHPKPCRAPDRRTVDRLLNRISGKLWIDREEFEVARADVFLQSEVNLLGGIAGSLKKLAYTMIRTRVADDLWFNTLSRGDFEGRKLLDSKRIRTKSEVTSLERAG